MSLGVIDSRYQHQFWPHTCQPLDSAERQRSISESAYGRSLLGHSRAKETISSASGDTLVIGSHIPLWSPHGVHRVWPNIPQANLERRPASNCPLQTLGPRSKDAKFALEHDANQFSVGFVMWSITRFGTGSCTPSSLSPSCSCTAVKIDGQLSGSCADHSRPN